MLMKTIQVTRSSMPEFDEYINEIKDMWDTHWLTNMGPKHKKFQEMLKEYLGVDNVELFTNGHMSLELTLQALNLQGEVITTPYTFASTTHAIVRNGLTPVFCDINPEDYTIDVSKIESLITNKTSAIVPVHVYGNVCNVEEIERIAKKYGLKVVYDAAHSFGETYKGIGTGAFGDVSCFSFHATKVFNSIEGGAACFKDSGIGERLYDLKNFGIHGPEVVTAVGANAKMNEFCAAMGICNLKHLEREIEKRKAVSERYVSNLSSVSGITLRRIQKDVKSNYSYFPVFFDGKRYVRNQVWNELKDHGIITRKYFCPLTSEFDCYAHSVDRSEKTPVAKAVSESVLALPLYADLSDEDVDRISEIVRSCNR